MKRKIAGLVLSGALVAHADAPISNWPKDNGELYSRLVQVLSDPAMSDSLRAEGCRRLNNAGEILFDSRLLNGGADKDAALHDISLVSKAAVGWESYRSANKAKGTTSIFE